VNRHETDPADVESIDAIIGALYDTISFDPGDEPDWERLRWLFLTDGSLIPPRDPSEESTQVLGIEAFINRAKRRIHNTEALQERGFREVEVSRRVDQFSNIAHVLSVYEGRFGSGEDDYAVRGINSVQLLFENDRWWVVGILWADENDENEIPERYLEED
jgi:hypothetical protein